MYSGGGLKSGNNTLRGYYLQDPGPEAFVGSIHEKYVSNNHGVQRESDHYFSETFRVA